MRIIFSVLAVSVLCAGGWPEVVRADSPPVSSGPAMTAAAQAFLAALGPAERALVARKFDDPARRDWHNIPKPVRKGLQFRNMNAQQRELCHALLRTALSKTGYEKAVRIMSLENNLREGERHLTGGHLRDPERYFLTLFGVPTAEGTWGWSFEGHHLSLNFVIQENKVIGDTPNFLGANPATVRLFVPGGPPVGMRTLALEEQRAFDLVSSLTETQRRSAVIAAKAPLDYRNPGQPEPPAGLPAGIRGSELTAPQQKILWSLLEGYCENLAAEQAVARLAEIRSAGFDQVHFAWAGATLPGVGHYFRVQGPTFVLELVNIQSDPQGNPANHIHSVWRSLVHDFGIAPQGTRPAAAIRP